MRCLVSPCTFRTGLPPLTAPAVEEASFKGASRAQEALWCDARSSMATMAQLPHRPFRTCCHHLGQWVMDAHLVSYLSLKKKMLWIMCAARPHDSWWLRCSLVMHCFAIFFCCLKWVFFNLFNFNHTIFYRDWSAGIVLSPFVLYLKAAFCLHV